MVKPALAHSSATIWASHAGLAEASWRTKRGSRRCYSGPSLCSPHPATGLTIAEDHHVVTLGDGSEATARAVIIATGVSYRRLGIPSLDRFVGTGAFYGAPGVEAPAMAGQEVLCRRRSELSRPGSLASGEVR